MILYLLFPVLIFGNVESQTANVTGHGELHDTDGNQTFTESNTNNSTMKPANLTSSLYKDEMSLIEAKLHNNQTSTVITEDDENFQEHENKIPGSHCRENLLVENSHDCDEMFFLEMMSIRKENWCVLEDVIRPYNTMTRCLERGSENASCYYPNSYIQDFFLDIHQFYFYNCSKEELPPLADAPQWLVIILTLIPVSLIPVLIYLVVWKSNIQE